MTGVGNSKLYRIDPKTNAIIFTVKLRETPRFLASAEGSIWVLNQGDGSVQRIDGMSGALVATIETTGFDGAFGDITTGGGYVWLSAPHNIPLAQIDPTTNTFIRKFSSHTILGGFIRFGAGSLWVSGFHIYRIQPPSG